MDTEGADQISAEELREAVSRLRWHHTMDLGRGIVTPGRDVFERVSRMSSSGTKRPMLVLFPDDELGGDPTNWWAPNESGVVAMLRDVGFSDVRVLSSRKPAVSAARGARRLARAVRSGDAAPVTTAQADRIVVHARR